MVVQVASPAPQFSMGTYTGMIHASRTGTDRMIRASSSPHRRSRHRRSHRRHSRLLVVVVVVVVVILIFIFIFIYVIIFIIIAMWHGDASLVAGHAHT